MLVRRTRSYQTKNEQSAKHCIDKVRIVLFGHAAVGKTSIIRRFLFDQFVEAYKQTIEDDYRQVLAYNNQTCDLTILDTAGSYQFPAMRQLAIESSHGFVLVYSSDDHSSFQEVKRLYKIIADLKGNRDIPFILVGNKADIIPVPPIPSEEIALLIQRMGTTVEHVECSAKTNHNINNIFYKLIQLIEAKRKERIEFEARLTKQKPRMLSIRTSIIPSNKTISPERRRRKTGQPHLTSAKL